MKQMLFALLVAFALTGCKTMTGLLSGVTTRDAATVKAIQDLSERTDKLIGRFGEQPVPVAEIEALQNAIKVQAEYESGKLKNTFAGEQWKIQADIARNGTNTLLEQWKAGVKMTKTEVEFRREIVARMWGKIASTEGRKDQP